jgi:single-strand DNA-binding protein
MSQISIIGNMTSEAEIRYTQGGKAVASVTVAVNRKRGDTEETDFHRVTLWESLAENAASLPKGTRVIVVGRLSSREFEDRQGQKRIGWDVTADAFGPDVRYATAQVTRAQASNATSGRTAPSTGVDEGWGVSGPQTGAQGWQANNDESPF